MVRKLFKHEAIYYARTLIIFEIILFFLALSTRFVMFFEFEHWIYYTVQASSFIIYGLAALACLYATIAISVIRFYKNLFSQEGYLTFALPISTNQHILVKLISALLYSGITLASIFITALITISGDFLNELINAAWYLLNQFLDVISFKDGVNIIFYIIYFAILFLLSSIYSTLLFYACIAIGQTAKKNRVLAAVGCYFGYNLALQIISTVFSISFNLLILSINMDNITEFIEKNPHLTAHTVFIFNIIFMLLINVIFYFIIHRIISRKLNLE